MNFRIFRYVHLHAISLLVVGILVVSCKPDPAQLHSHAIVCDLHCDTAMRVLRGASLGERSDMGHIDIPRLLEGGVDLQAFACWVNPDRVDPEQYGNATHEMIDSLYSQFRSYPDSIAIARTGTEAEEIIARGDIAALLAIEGGHSMMNSLDTLRSFHQRGVRYMTLTWNNSTDWAIAADDTEHVNGGLTDFGRDVIGTMNDIGMIIDVSHLAERTFWGVIETTRHPIIASHSCVDSICPHFRNLNDDQIRAIADNGGVIGIAFVPWFLDSTFSNNYNELRKRNETEIDSLWEVYKGDWNTYTKKRNELLGDDLTRVTPTVDVLIDHIDYIVNLVGPDHVGLGSDYDGTSVVPLGLEDCSHMPIITEKLLKRGYSSQDILGILGGNFMRVFKEVAG